MNIDECNIEDSLSSENKKDSLCLKLCLTIVAIKCLSKNRN